MKNSKLMTIVELPLFLKRVASVLDEAEKEALINYLAANPEKGDEIPRTGGLRKLRWAAKDKGKRGGARVIYYFYNESAPVFLLSIYRKGVQENLRSEEEKKLTRLVALLKEACRIKRG